MSSSSSPSPLVLLAVLLSACSTTQVYSGPKLTAEQVARVDGTIIFFGVGETNVLIKSIDGVDQIDGDSIRDLDYVGDLELLPGEHTLGVRYEYASLRRTSLAPCWITFRAEAGHSYQVDGTSFPTGEVWSCWIDDKQTQQRTEGAFRQAGDERLWPPFGGVQNSPPK